MRQLASSRLVQFLAICDGSFARSRLVQFLVIGAAIFAIAPAPADDRRIEITRGEIDTAQAAEATRHAMTPTKAAEVTGRLIEDKLLFREGVRLGLDRDDPIIEQRVVQKVLLLAEDLGGANREPTADDLRAEYERAKDRYTQPPRYHLVHVFSSKAEALPAPAGLSLDRAPAAGEPFPLPRDTTATHDDLARSYGPEFADAVAALPAGGGYSEPIASAYGWHRVRVVEVLPGRVRPFAEVARDISFELALRRREDVLRRFLDDTARRYEIVIDGTTQSAFVPPLRMARREAPSGED